MDRTAFELPADLAGQSPDDVLGLLISIRGDEKIDEWDLVLDKPELARLLLAQGYITTSSNTEAVQPFDWRRRALGSKGDALVDAWRTHQRLDEDPGFE